MDREKITVCLGLDPCVTTSLLCGYIWGLQCRGYIYCSVGPQYRMFGCLGNPVMWMMHRHWMFRLFRLHQVFIELYGRETLRNQLVHLCCLTLRRSFPDGTLRRTPWMGRLCHHRLVRLLMCLRVSQTFACLPLPRWCLTSLMGMRDSCRRCWVLLCSVCRYKRRGRRSCLLPVPWTFWLIVFRSDLRGLFHAGG